MARRSVTWIAPADFDRDAAKVFIITEMPADQGERWATLAMELIAKAGQKIPEGAEHAGMAGLASADPDLVILDADKMAALAVTRALQDPVLDALWECVQYRHDLKNPLQPIYDGVNSQIEEIRTRRALRMEVLKLHLNPSVAAELPSSVNRTPLKA